MGCLLVFQLIATITDYVRLGHKGRNSEQTSNWPIIHSVRQTNNVPEMLLPSVKSHLGT